MSEIDGREARELNLAHLGVQVEQADGQRAVVVMNGNSIRMAAAAVDEALKIDEVMNQGSEVRIGRSKFGIELQAELEDMN